MNENTLHDVKLIQISHDTLLLAGTKHNLDSLFMLLQK
jgi:hypothetical protein